MDVVEWLEQVEKLDKLIENKIAERDRLAELARNITSAPMSDMPKARGNVSSKIEEATIRLIEKEWEIDRLIDRYVDLRDRVVHKLEKLPAKEYNVLHKYYIQFKTMEQVSKEMNYCESHAWRIHKRALTMLEHAME